MALPREENVDNAKHGRTFTKAQASVQMPIWPSMGAWAAPGYADVPVTTEDNKAYQAGQRDVPAGSKITGEAPEGWSNIDGADFELDEPGIGTQMYRPSGRDSDGDWDND